MRKISFFLIIACSFVGCGKKPDPPGFHQIAFTDPTTFVPSAKITITEPADHATVGASDKFDCTVLLSSPDGKLPTFPTAEIRQGKKNYWQDFLKPTGQKKDGGYEFKATLKAPKKPGQYEVHAFGHQIVQSFKGAPDGGGVENGSASVEISVR